MQRVAAAMSKIRKCGGSASHPILRCLRSTRSRRLHYIPRGSSRSRRRPARSALAVIYGIEQPPRARTNSGDAGRRQSVRRALHSGPQMCSFSHSCRVFLRASWLVWRFARPSCVLVWSSLPCIVLVPGPHLLNSVYRPCERPGLSRRCATVVCAARCRRDLDRIAYRPAISGCSLPVDPTGGRSAMGSVMLLASPYSPSASFSRLP